MSSVVSLVAGGVALPNPRIGSEANKKSKKRCAFNSFFDLI